MDLAQNFGLLAIGETVCREFGEDGIFYGLVTAYRKSGQGGIYTVQYTDGDLEDMDLEEYNFAYALWLKEEGWDIEEGDVADVEAEAVPDKAAQKKKRKKVRSLFVVQKHFILTYMNALM